MNLSSFQNWCDLPTPMGEFRMYDTGDENIRVVSVGDVLQIAPVPLLRVHSSCLASEVFAARDCDCADQLRESMKLIANEGSGLIIHMRQEGRGHGLSRKIQAVGAMQREGLDTVEAFESLGLEQDTRTYGCVVEILNLLCVREVRLITNNPSKARYLRANGVGVHMVNTHPTVRPENLAYLQTKREKLDHGFVFEFADDSARDVRFYHSDQPFGSLSNFSAHAIWLDGKIWPTVEHFYQAQKFTGTNRQEHIRSCETPILAKRTAGNWEVGRKPNWALIKEGVMLAALRAKFSQHPDLRALLVGTGDRVLVEHTHLDAYWGSAGDGSGKNRLGALLMVVRGELQTFQNDARAAG